jgi:transketolase N-terminal domain/subunit
MILSKGHGCIAQYVMLAEKGFIPYETRHLLPPL